MHLLPCCCCCWSCCLNCCCLCCWCWQFNFFCLPRSRIAFPTYKQQPDPPARLPDESPLCHYVMRSPVPVAVSVPVSVPVPLLVPLRHRWHSPICAVTYTLGESCSGHIATLDCHYFFFFYDLLSNVFRSLRCFRRSYVQSIWLYSLLLTWLSFCCLFTGYAVFFMMSVYLFTWPFLLLIFLSFSEKPQTGCAKVSKKIV